MGDEDEIRTTYYASHFDMDEAFCARMMAAIAAGLESAPVGVITTPGTKNPAAQPPCPLVSSRRLSTQHRKLAKS